MKLSRALKEKKRLAAEISHVKNIIGSKNSFVKDSNVPTKFDVSQLFADLERKTQELVNLKIVINEANNEIQPSIYLLGEYKALVAYLAHLNTAEGFVQPRGFRSEAAMEFDVQFDEIKVNLMKKDYQDKADRIQDQIDTYNYTTEVAWGEDEPKPDKASN